MRVFRDTTIGCPGTRVAFVARVAQVADKPAKLHRNTPPMGQSGGLWGMVARVVGSVLGEAGDGSWAGGELVFLGTYTPKLDDKGRLTLPAKFRDALAGGLMVTKSQDHSLAVYPRSGVRAAGAPGE